MIDLTLLRKDPELVIARIKRKDPSFDAQLLYDMDAQVRETRAQVEALRHKKNELAQQGKSGVTPELRSQSQQISAQLKQAELDLADQEIRFNTLYLTCPNVPDDDLPVGGKEANKVVKEVGKKPHFDFPIKNHVELGETLGWFDFQQATTMTGSNFVFYKGDAVKLMYALTMLMIKNNIKHGFIPVLPPYVVNEKSLEVASNFPKFRDQVYRIEEDALYLSPTSEVNLTNVYRNHIFMADALPVRMTAWTSCFRREAGSYGAHERGLIRIHQFEKVELYTICEPAYAAQEHERMLACAEDILQQLGLHYRVSLLATQDCSFPSAKTWDIEVWLPGQNAYYEVSSCSNCTDFQARRGLIRYKKTSDSKTELVNTLNASSLALPRLMVALMEVYQQADGSIALPDVLTKNSLFA
ncbi:MAG: serine--tRNA ligase [Candidatus Babeliales bacterium]